LTAAFLEDVRSRATIDRHLADQLVLFCALASAGNLALEGRRVEIEGVALRT
jgi:RNA 3'-terminal phosphate cyclase